MGQKFRLQDSNTLVDKGIFFDANVLIYLFWPTGSFHWEKNYAKTFSILLRQRNQLFVDFLVVSEVINRILRIEHQKINPDQKFKDFRDSSDGREALNDIHTILRDDVLSRFIVIGKSFSKNDILDFLTVNELDFVDKGTALLCKENNLILLTNDKDFKNSDIDILTGNPSLLN
ncbi:PIN domain-containing protein [Cognataquiflexum rubidum]|uniref:PIN domain-containing protein n=1 Tax=Cognataquiflexum rubidum TaxID=2922273 RepID=UPI001F13FE63|nr:PIN domain-containing protein [Cognataquiflexum rubidum]MCH6236791.1 PIN domain-containing protein [Cognataquiflexum rubidum]